MAIHLTIPQYHVYHLLWLGYGRTPIQNTLKITRSALSSHLKALATKGAIIRGSKTTRLAVSAQPPDLEVELPVGLIILLRRINPILRAVVLNYLSAIPLVPFRSATPHRTRGDSYTWQLRSHVNELLFILCGHKLVCSYKSRWTKEAPTNHLVIELSNPHSEGEMESWFAALVNNLRNDYTQYCLAMSLPDLDMHNQLIVPVSKQPENQC